MLSQVVWDNAGQPGLSVLDPCWITRMGPKWHMIMNKSKFTVSINTWVSGVINGGDSDASKGWTAWTACKAWDAWTSSNAALVRILGSIPRRKNFIILPRMMQNNLFFLSIQDQIKLIYINLTSLKIVMKKKQCLSRIWTWPILD